MITAAASGVSGVHGGGCHVAMETTSHLGLGLGSGVREE